MGELVLVTGASGFIAAHIIQQLLQEGYKVRGTVRDLKDDRKIKPLKELVDNTLSTNLELFEANLLDPDCWPKAVEGCIYVMHTASPFPMENPEHEDELIKPALEGTMNVLRACGRNVKRFVLTSSVAAIHAGHRNPPNGSAFTEEDWTNVENVNMVYEKSKTLAEKAAWDYVNGLPVDQRIDMAVINPSLVVGPLISTSVSTSVNIIKRIMIRDMPMLPRINFNVVDVRDVAAAHVVAMKSANAVGKRHIVSGQNMWFKDIAAVIEKEFKPMGYKIPTSNAPYCMLWLIGRCDASVRMILPAVGQVARFDNTRMTQVLGITPRPVADSILDCCYSLVDNGVVNKTTKYKPREE